MYRYIKTFGKDDDKRPRSSSGALKKCHIIYIVVQNDWEKSDFEWKVIENTSAINFVHAFHAIFVQ